MGSKFSPERLADIRRLRRARYLYRKMPLFAFHLMCQQYPHYHYGQFLEDLRYRRPPKKRKSRSPLARYGRYRRIEQLTAQYMVTGDITFALSAMRLRRNITKPYRVMFRTGGKCLEWQFCPLIPIERIERLVVQLSGCRNERDAKKFVEQFSAYSHIN